MQKGMLSNEQLFVLHKHWIWANMIKRDFYNKLDEEKKSKKSKIGGWFSIESTGYMSIWYGLLFGVLEVIKKKKIEIEGLDELDNLFEPLKLHRNQIFHPQAKYWSHKFFEIMKDPQSANKIRKIHSALGRYFLKEYKLRNLVNKLPY